MTRISFPRNIAVIATVLVALLLAARLPAAAPAAGGPDFDSTQVDALWRTDVQQALRLRSVELDRRGLPVARSFQARSTAAAQGAAAAAAGDPYAYFPTASTTDGRMLSLAGTGLSTLAGQEVYVSFASPQSASHIRIGIFDGDAGGVWDRGATGVEYTLYADPQSAGATQDVLAVYESSSMPDQAWFNIELPNDPRAQAPSGHFFYNMRVRLTNPNVVATCNFKVRCDGSLSIKPGAFTVIDSIDSSNGDALGALRIIYPSYPALFPTNYDGTWSFVIDNPLPCDYFEVWDGDFDLGTTVFDTDDANTPPVVPNFANPTAVNPEGAAGAEPRDDTHTALLRRDGSPVYRIVLPDGQIFMNGEPSGNSEWERFRIDRTGTLQPSISDAITSILPAGLYRLEVSALDLAQLVGFRFPFPVLGVQADGTPRAQLRPHLVSGVVFADTNNNGLRDGGESGIGGVQVQLHNSSQQAIGSGITGADGSYSFQVEGRKHVLDPLGDLRLLYDGAYTVVVADGNFQPGAPLQNHRSTTGGTQRAATVLGANVGGLDFGYSAGSSLSGLVWFDSNLNGTKTPNESGQPPSEPGMPGVMVHVEVDINCDDRVDYTQCVSTDDQGRYTLLGVPSGRCRLYISVPSLISGLDRPTADPDGITSAHQAQFMLAVNEIRGDLNFGYRGVGCIGDLVWNDRDGDRCRDSGEDGIAGVTLRLRGDWNNDGILDFQLQDTTDSCGAYLFNTLCGGRFITLVDTATLPSAYTLQTFDVDGTATPHAALLSLAPTAARLDVDFGYRTTTGSGCIGDTVWFDADRDGCRDDGEPGIRGVRLTLYGDLDCDGEFDDLTRSTVTNGEGCYQFNGLPIGLFRVNVDPTSLPAGFLPVCDSDGISTPHQVTQCAPLDDCGCDNSLDFGYAGTGRVGDRVWNDANGNCKQDSWESGYLAVKVILTLDWDGDGCADYTAATLTDLCGNYAFCNLPAGRVTVTVCTGVTPLLSVCQTYDRDGLSTRNCASLTLAPGQCVNDVDFGYRGLLGGLLGL